MHSPLLESLARQGGITSGAPVAEGFTQGWGILPFNGKRAHNWRRIKDDTLPEGTWRLVSACGMENFAAKRLPLLGPGTFEYCQRCENKLMRR